MNPFELLQNTAKLKEEAEKMQEELNAMSAQGSSGGKMVTVTVNGKMEITDIHLDPVCVDNRDVKMLEDLIMAAHHDALHNMQEQIKEKAGPLLSGLNIPGLGL
jgi:DNA-binding protein, YbaB/EbfC family